MTSSLTGTHIADHVPLRVGAGLSEGGQERLQMLGAVVLSVEQQHGEQLRGPDPCGHQPVGYVVGNGRHQLTQVSHHKLSAAQPWTLHWRREWRTLICSYSSTVRYQFLKNSLSVSLSSVSKLLCFPEWLWTISKRYPSCWFSIKGISTTYRYSQQAPSTLFITVCGLFI